MLDRYQIGRQKMQEVIGQDTDEIIAIYKKISPDYADYIVKFAYGDLYTRPGLSDKLRELAAIACLIGQGNTGLPLKVHLQNMLNVGWKIGEIKEVLIFLLVYIGFPTISETFSVLEEVIKNQKINSKGEEK